MRFSTILACGAASALAFAAHAQDMPPPGGAPAGPPSATAPMPGDTPGPMPGGTDTMPPPTGNPMPGDGMNPPPPPPAPGGTMTPPPPPPPGGGQVEMMPQRPVEQTAPQPPAEYPVCSRTVKDGCKNPGGQ
ncbi:hypothetical protein M2337_003036 [Sphingobium sp. B2D3A]|uniref:hypothetical protein n=1 Tax=unclassified Sphingobium TaxID=2611147 RepID=UPI0022247620|nr:MULTISPECIES: hypothetical protein [unclassified Sphingobium]MCW2338776.1 hypothetical protein [Sphingobium sp. B2D3A]MCW2338803.1 hypothetical protein [Sphingobium sp. B2D3A]MCW2385234.1 hypothetical protein [Sphingobium sp. B2D3D]